VFGSHSCTVAVNNTATATLAGKLVLVRLDVVTTKVASGLGRLGFLRHTQFFSVFSYAPIWFCSVRQLYLVSLAQSEDINKYGLDVFLTPFVEDLKTLYCDGITIGTNENQQTLYGGLLAFLADNLVGLLS